MQLITRELEEMIPAMYSDEDTKLENRIIYAKLYTPDSRWTWWILEYDKAERICFAMVHGLEKELGYVSVAELESVTGPLGLKVERDLHFMPTRYGDIEELKC